MGTQRVYFRQHLYSTAWPIYDFARTECRERRLALVMGFNNKCGVTSGMEAGRRVGGREGWREGSTKGAATGRWMQINSFSALTEEPKTPAQQNKHRSPGGRAQSDKSL